MSPRALYSGTLELRRNRGDESLVLCQFEQELHAFASHHAIRSSRAKPESARNRMRVRGQWARTRNQARHSRRIQAGAA